MEEFYDKIIKKLEKDLDMENDNNIIEELFEQRCEVINVAIKKNKEYQKYMKKIDKVNKEIREKYNNTYEIIESIIEYEKLSYESGFLCEELMYKFGILDGMKLILEGTKQIDIAKFIKENK